MHSSCKRATTASFNANRKKKSDKHTQRAERGLLNDSERAVVDCQVANFEREEDEALQLRQLIVAQLEIEDDGAAGL